MSQPERKPWGPGKLIAFVLLWALGLWSYPIIATLVSGLLAFLYLVAYFGLLVWFIRLYRRHRPPAPGPPGEW